jgi:hypothetical protein
MASTYHRHASVAHRLSLHDIPAEIRVKIYNFYFGHISRTALQDQVRSLPLVDTSNFLAVRNLPHIMDHLDLIRAGNLARLRGHYVHVRASYLSLIMDHLNLVHADSLARFLAILHVDRLTRKEAGELFLDHHFHRYNYAVQSRESLAGLIGLPRYYTIQHPDMWLQGLHDVKIRVRGFDEGLALFELFKTALIGYKNVLKWPELITDEELDRSYVEIDPFVMVEKRREGQPLVFEARAWPQNRYEMSLRGQLMQLPWDFDVVPSRRPRQEPDQQAGDLMDQICQFFEQGGEDGCDSDAHSGEDSTEDDDDDDNNDHGDDQGDKYDEDVEDDEEGFQRQHPVNKASSTQSMTRSIGTTENDTGILSLLPPIATSIANPPLSKMDDNDSTIEQLRHHLSPITIKSAFN